MRHRKPFLLLPLLVCAVASGACGAPEDDESDGQAQGVTGGSGSIESPVVFLFEGASANAGPKCAGAMLSQTMAVTAKSCAKVGLAVGRAADNDGRGKRAKVRAVHLPPGPDADIAVVELDAPLSGATAVITHMPLRAGYAVNAFAAVSGRNFFSLEKNEASTVTATMTEETETHGSIVPAKGSEICEGDFGAPVCSSTGGKIYGYNLYGTCGLSGLVVSRADAPASPASPDEPASPAASKPNTNPAKCSGGAWKVAELGRYRDFLAKLAPSAFAPLRIDKPIIREFSYVPEGLWGYQTDGGVAACALDGAKLNAVKPGALSAKLSAKVSFSGMDRRAAAWGRFGIAPKSEPTRMRWLPAQRLDTSTAVSFDSQFEGAVSSDLVGEYIVAFRASANGGETWTTCDTDGIENGYSADKTLSLSVAVAPAAPPSGSAPPTDNTAPSGDRAASDPPPVQGETVSDGEGDAGAAPSTKKKSAGGCAVSTTPSALASAPPIVGVLLGLAAVARRRRRV